MRFVIANIFQNYNIKGMNSFLKINILLILCLSFLFLSKAPETKAQTPSSDTIAIRVLNNFSHYSPLRWYEEQGFTGSPQRLQVDGYEAIRDGRTVYVAASNVSGTNMYTNIYLISHNAKADNNTTDLFEKILLNWRFNRNLMGMTGVGYCVDMETRLATGKQCYVNSECEYPEVCFSDKANTIRDTKRYSDLVELSELVNEYKDKKGSFPSVSAGSYLSNRTLSTWPSWQSTLGVELAAEIPIDPLNDMCDCGDTRFNPITCWDEEAKDYAGGNFNLPNPCSRAYLYKSDPSGIAYDLCALFDTSYTLYPVPSGFGACGGFDGSRTNNEPVFSSQLQLINAHIGEDYTAYVSAFDADGDALNWTISSPSFGGAAVIPHTVSNFHKRISIPAGSLGVAGAKTVDITISDGIDSETETFNINVLNY